MKNINTSPAIFKSLLRQMIKERKDFIEKLEQKIKAASSILEKDSSIYNAADLVIIFQVKNVNSLVANLIPLIEKLSRKRIVTDFLECDYNGLVNTLEKLDIEPEFLSKYENKVVRNLTKMIKEYISYLNQTIEYEKFCVFQIQQIINAFDNEKAINSIDNFKLFILFLSYLVMNYEFSYEDANKCYAMAVYYGAVCKKEKLPYGISQLGKFLNRDGSLRKNGSYEDLAHIIGDINESISKDFHIEDYLIISQIHTYLLMEYEYLLDNSKEELSPEKAITFQKAERKDLEELSLYYSKGMIISLPEDINEFIELMDRCLLGEEEKRYVLNLIKEKLKEQKDSVALKLSGNELAVYQESREIVKGLKNFEEDYYIYLELFKNLSDVSSMLNEDSLDDEDKEYIEDEITTLINRLKELNLKHTKKDEISENRLLLLTNNTGRYVILDDIDGIDNSLRKYIFPVLERITKEKEASFRKVLGKNTGKYVPYMVNNGKIQASFVEIESGIYVLLSVQVKDTNINVTFNRLDSFSSSIKELEQIIKNPELKNGLLKSSEQALHDIENEYINSTKKNI